MSDHYEATIGDCRIEVEATTNMIAYNYHLIINDQKVDTAAATVVGVAYLRGQLKTKSILPMFSLYLSDVGVGSTQQFEQTRTISTQI